jgi:hypothetical protein
VSGPRDGHLYCPLCHRDRTLDAELTRAANAAAAAAGKRGTYVPTCPDCGAHEAPWVWRDGALRHLGYERGEQ